MSRFNISKTKITGRQVRECYEDLKGEGEASRYNPKLLYYVVRGNLSDAGVRKKIVEVCKKRLDNQEFDTMGNWKVFGQQGMI